MRKVTKIKVNEEEKKKKKHHTVAICQDFYKCELGHVQRSLEGPFVTLHARTPETAGHDQAKKRKYSGTSMFIVMHTCPTTNGGMQNGSSVGMRARVAYTSLHVWRRFACSVGLLIDKISAPELSWKFFSKCALLVG